MARQKRVRFSMTRHDAATLMTILWQAAQDEPGMLAPEDSKVADKLMGRLQKLLQPRISAFASYFGKGER